jgi:hypothetical protein
MLVPPELLLCLVNRFNDQRTYHIHTTSSRGSTRKEQGDAERKALWVGLPSRCHCPHPVYPHAQGSAPHYTHSRHDKQGIRGGHRPRVGSEAWSGVGPVGGEVGEAVGVRGCVERPSALPTYRGCQVHAPEMLVRRPATGAGSRRCSVPRAGPCTYRKRRTRGWVWMGWSQRRAAPADC